MHVETDFDNFELTNRFTVVLKREEIAAVFNPKEVLMAARNIVAAKTAEKITERLFPLLDKAIQECDWNAANNLRK